MKRLRRRLMGILLVTAILLWVAWCLLTAMQTGETDIFTPAFFMRKGLELWDQVRSKGFLILDKGREWLFWLIDEGRSLVDTFLQKGV